MSEKGFCPTCGIPWPNFCPIDGTRLTGAWTCANAPKPVIRPMAAPQIDAAADTLEMDPAVRKAVPRAPAPAPAAPAPAPAPAPVAKAPTPAPAPAAKAPEPAAPAPEAEPLRRRPASDMLRTFVENVGARPPATTRGDRSRRGDPRQAATIIQPQLSDEDILKARERAAERAKQAEAEAASAAEGAADKKKKRDGFSDTQWFMKGLSLEVADPETGAVVVDEKDYEVDESIPEAERRKYTLRKKGEE